MVIFLILVAVGAILLIPAVITVIVIACIKSGNKKQEQEQTSPPEPKPPREKLSASAIMLLIGTAFIVLAAITFVAANWLDMSAIGRVLALLAESALAFGISALLKKVIGLNRTSMAFYMIGSIISVISFITAGYYGLFGSWFSVSGDGAALLYGVSAIAIASLSFVAKPIYKSKAFDYIGCSFVSLAIIFFCIQPVRYYGEFFVYLAVAQLIITGVIHILKPQKNTEMERPVIVVGDISAVVYQLIAGTYVFLKTFSPEWRVFTILVILMVQLAGYGIFKKKKWMFVFFNLVGVYSGLIVSGMCEDYIGEDNAMLVFSFITMGFYIVNRLIPNNLTSCHGITLAAVIIGSIVSFAAGNSSNYLLCLIVPAVASIGIASYALNKEKSVQTASGLFAPVIPFFMAMFLAEELPTGGNMGDAEITVLVYGVLALIYMISAAFLVFLPELNFNFYANHPVKSQTFIYVNMIAATAVLLNISESSRLFMIPVVLCVVQFIVSYKMTCNIMAAGSVISLILLTNSLISEHIKSKDLGMYIMFGLFAVLVIISRIVFPDGFSIRTESKLRIDVILLSSWTAVMPFPMFDRLSFFLRTIALAVFIAGFIKKKTDKDNAAVMLSISAALACLAFMTRPFLTPESSMIASKINIGIFALLGVAYRLIWKNHPYSAKLASTVIFIISFASLIVDGIIFDNAGNRIFVLAVTAGILVFSFFAKSKTWFLASSVSLVIMTVTSTVRYFNSAGWWIYLLAVGVIFITIASINEVCRKKGESVKSAVAKKFSDWSW